VFAVISLGGKQYRVHKGEYLTVDRLAHEPGSTFSPPVLLASSDADVLIDADALAKVTVTARVDEHLLGPKIRVFQYKPKKSTKKARGHRSRLSRITIQDIAVGSPAKKASAAKAAPEKAPAAKAAPETAPVAKAAAKKAPAAKAKAEKEPAAKAAPRKAPAKPRAKPTPATDEPATEQEA
jgi:large subunit ribosomal protein L21